MQAMLHIQNTVPRSLSSECPKIMKGKESSLDKLCHLRRTEHGVNFQLLLVWGMLAKTNV